MVRNIQVMALVAMLSISSGVFAEEINGSCGCTSVVLEIPQNLNYRFKYRICRKAHVIDFTRRTKRIVLGEVTWGIDCDIILKEARWKGREWLFRLRRNFTLAEAGTVYVIPKSKALSEVFPKITVSVRNGSVADGTPGRVMFHRANTPAPW